MLFRSGGVPIGLFQYQTYSREIVDVESGSVVVIYTDGVTEAMNISNQEFGEELLLLKLEKYHNYSSSEIIDSIFSDIDFHAKGFEQSDDITCISISRLKLDGP